MVEETAKTSGVSPDFVASAAELGQDVGREKSGIAAGDVNVDVAPLHEGIQYPIKPNRPLHPPLGLSDGKLGFV